MSKFFILIVLVALSSCTTMPVYDYEPDVEKQLLAEVMGELTAVEEDVDVLALNDEIRAALDRQIQGHWSRKRKLEELRKFLFSSDELGVQYSANATKTAMETFETGSGNCLSLTSLFVAASRYVGLDANYRTIEVRPTWDNSSGTIVRYEHIVASGKLTRGETYVVDFLPEFVIGDKASRRVSDSTALSLYYNNLGAESLIDGNMDEALSWLRRALALRPAFSDGWNNMGAVMNRMGRPELAEFSYRKALLEDSTNYSALSNLADFYRSVGNEKKADQFMKAVNRYRQRNPYFHYFVARLLFDEGRLEDARALLERSIELKRDEPDFYTALARVHESLGDERLSQQMRARAEKYMEPRVQAPERNMNHRIWTIQVN